MYGGSKPVSSTITVVMCEHVLLQKTRNVNEDVYYVLGGSNYSGITGSSTVSGNVCR